MPLSKLKLEVFSSGKSQLSISKSIGINPSRLNLIVNEWINPSEREKKLLAEELGKPIGELFSEKDKNSKG